MNRNITNIEQDIIMSRQAFRGVQNFRYLGASIIKKMINDEIKSRIAAGSRCFILLRQIFMS
jgi:hypothetical protein